MARKKIIALLVATTSFLLLSGSAFADLFFVSGAVPLQHSFADSSIKSDGVSGLQTQVKLPLMLAFGYEQYETKLKDVSYSEKLQTQMYDVAFQLPIPIINVTLGAGLGSMKMNYTSNSYVTYKDVSLGKVTQWYGQLGVPFFPFLDIFLSYHTVSAKMEWEVSGTKQSDLNLGGNVTSLGISFGF